MSSLSPGGDVTYTRVLQDIWFIPLGLQLLFFPVYIYLVISVTLDGVTVQLLAPVRCLWRKLCNRAAML